MTIEWWHFRWPCWTFRSYISHH